MSRVQPYLKSMQYNLHVKFTHLPLFSLCIVYTHRRFVHFDALRLNVITTLCSIILSWDLVKQPLNGEYVLCTFVPILLSLIEKSAQYSLFNSHFQLFSNYIHRYFICLLHKIIIYIPLFSMPHNEPFWSSGEMAVTTHCLPVAMIMMFF